MIEIRPAVWLPMREVQMGMDRGVAEGNSLETLWGNEHVSYLHWRLGTLCMYIYQYPLNCTFKICAFHTQLILIRGASICEFAYLLVFICNPKSIHVLSWSFTDLSMHRSGENLSHLVQVPRWSQKRQHSATLVKLSSCYQVFFPLHI